MKNSEESHLDNVEFFIKEVKNNKMLFGLFHEQDGWANCYANDNPEAKGIYLFWDSAEGAEKLKSEEWQNYQVTPIALSDFLDSWLDGMQEQHVYAGVNWDEQLRGFEIEASLLSAALSKEEL